MVAKRVNQIVQNFKYNVRLKGITRVHFVKSEWDTPDPADRVSWPYLTYRGVYLLYFIVFLTYSLYRDGNSGFWLLYATHWSFLVQTFYGLALFVNLSYRFYLYRKYLSIRKYEGVEVGDTTRARHFGSPTQLNPLDSMAWLLLSVASIMPVVVSVGYWGLIYDSSKEMSSQDLLVNLTVHGFNAVLALVDIFVVAIPVRVAHALYTFLFTLIYLLFSVIYDAAGGSYRHEDEGEPYVYSFLNWREEGGSAALAAVIALVVAVVLHVGLWCLYTFRLHLVARFRTKSIYFVKT